MSAHRNDLVHTTLASPIGVLSIVADDTAGTIVEVRFANSPLAGDEGGRRADDHPVLRRGAAQLREYFAGERTVFDVALAPRGTAFQLAAWAALTTIPYGETVSYGEQARRLGDARKARAVGSANGANPIPIIVPCHRVVGSDGGLTGFGGGLDAKRWLLAHERRVVGIELDLR